MKKSVSGIYCIENIINGKKYIGSSINIHKRKNSHFYGLKRNKHKNCKLQNSYNLHGKEAFIFYLLLEVDDKKILIEKEQYFINEIKPAYNINLIANSSLGVKRSEETKQKVREANLGLKHPEWRNKIKSKAQGGENHWTKNKKFSEESKQKMSNSQKKLFKNGYKHPNSKIVIQLDLNNNSLKEWESSTIAAKELNLNAMGIANCARGVSKTSGNYKWKYKIKE